MNKFSIILPVRNGGEYLKECVKSILAQTLQDFNFIVLDNCSTDGSAEWLESLQNEKIIIYKADKSLSIEENWGRIVDVPKNEFITLIGHDDILYPDFLETINSLILQYPDASLYHTHFNFINAESGIIRRSKPMKHRYTGNELLQGLLTLAVDSMGTGYVMRSTDYDKQGGIPVRYPSLLFADFELWLKLARINYEVVSERTCFAFRVHQSTTTTSKDAQLHKALGIFVNFLAGLKADEKDAAIIRQHAPAFLLTYASSYSNRLLRTPLELRGNVKVKDYVKETRNFAALLGLGTEYKPEKKMLIKIAMVIDSNFFLRKIFLAFKKTYSKPVIK
ncbi:MAG: glycosyltransferase [Ferruginibacter sp.]